MIETGVVSFYDPAANFGFIEPDSGRADLSFTLQPGDILVEAGDVVTFERLATPYITDIGPTATRVRRAGFAPEEQEVAIREPETV